MTRTLIVYLSNFQSLSSISVHVFAWPYSMCGHTGCILDTQRVCLSSAVVCCSCRATETWREMGRKRRGYLMKPSLRDKESNQSPWCVTWPGPCHHKAPVVARNIHLYPSFTTPTSFPSLHSPERERKRWGDSQTDRKRESRQRPCECVSYGTDLVLMTPAHTPLIPSPCAHPLPLSLPTSTPTSLRPGQYHPFIRNAGLFQCQCPMALPIQAPIHPSGHMLPELVPHTY